MALRGETLFDQIPRGRAWERWNRMGRTHIGRYGSVVLLLSAAPAAATGPDESSSNGNPIAAPQQVDRAPECDASRANFAIGKKFNAVTAENARVASGAIEVKEHEQGTPDTLEVRSGRLTVFVDQNELILGVTCG